MSDPCKKRHLIFRDFLGGRQFFFFEIFEDLAGALKEGFGESGEASHFDSVTFIDSAFMNLVEKEDAFFGLLNVDAVIFGAREFFGKADELVVMRGK